MKRLGVEIKVEEIKRIEAGRKEKGSRVSRVVKVGSEKEKRRIMQNKLNWKLKGEELWEDDLTRGKKN